ncbi:MAG: thioredoxin family protein [Bacteroidales bacterium]
MKRIILVLSLTILTLGAAFGQGYEIGDKATDFKLKNVDGKMVSMADYSDAKGFIVIFSCNHCPYVIAYEDRMIELHNKYAPKGFPVIAINPNDPDVQPQDSYEKMIERSNEKNFPFVYLFDEGQKIYPKYGATRTPHVYLLNKKEKDLIVEYIGTIDDNYKDADKVKKNYLADAIDALLAGKKPKVTETKAIGCSIKTKK